MIKRGKVRERERQREGKRERVAYVYSRLCFQFMRGAPEWHSRYVRGGIKTRPESGPESDIVIGSC